MERVLITGAAGVLGRELVSLLEQEGAYELRLTDMAPLQTAHEFVLADLADPAQVTGLAEGMAQVVHAAAIHPWKPYTPQQYLDCNIKGTYHVVEEAARAGARLVYTSSVAAMGYEVTPDSPLPFDERRPCRPVDSLYSVSKHVGEQFCALFQRSHGLRWLALRPGTFIPRDESDPQYGLSLLGIGVHRRDVARAHVLALQSDLAYEGLVITAGVPFSQTEGELLLTDARSVILRHFPEAANLEAAGIALPQALPLCYRMDKARELLGYEPRHTFAKWLEAWLVARA
jgi:nucleoside-diphosphate-sugar epimerase